MRATQLRSNSHARYDEGSASVSSSSPHDTHNFATSIKSDAQLASFISRKSNILHCKIRQHPYHSNTTHPTPSLCSRFRTWTPSPICFHAADAASYSSCPFYAGVKAFTHQPLDQPFRTPSTQEAKERAAKLDPLDQKADR